MENASNLLSPAIVGLLCLIAPSPAGPLDIVRDAEQQRVELVQRIAPAVVCVFDEHQRGGGSGVLIDADGFGLTNYHVVAGLMTTRKGWGGLGDGVLYELQVLGVDVTGDVAMFRLIPPRERFTFPHASLGDSDTVRLGDPVLALGNPFSLSDDYSPTVTLGIVTGVNRYQKGFRGNLTYTDCIQTDASINPGNSGGPLFNLAGEIIGINGRISVNTRGRFNVGFAYAISANQIRRFIPAMRAGLLAKHGIWDATVSTLNNGDVVFDQMLREGAAFRAGLRIGDVLLAVDGAPMASANQVTSLLGTYPADWPLLIRAKRETDLFETIVRLGPVDPQLRTPIEPDPIVAAGRIRRLLERHRTVGGEAFDPSRGAEFEVERTRLDGPQQTTETYTLAVPSEGPARLTRRVENGASGRILEFDAVSAKQRAAPDAEAFDLTPAEAMTLSAMYVALVDSRRPFESIEIERVRHVGASALLPVSFSMEPKSVEAGEPQPEWNPQTLEVIDWSLGDQGRAALGFSADTGRLVFISVRDRLSGATVDIRVQSDPDSPSAELAVTFHVQGAGMHYKDVVTAAVKTAPQP